MAVLELLLSEQCPLLQVCMCVCVHCSKCVCVCVSTAPSVCALGWVKCREHISLLVILCIIVYVKKKEISVIVFFQNRYPIMVKCLNIGKNIGKPIYWAISTIYYDCVFSNWLLFFFQPAFGPCVFSDVWGSPDSTCWPCQPKHQQVLHIR